MLGALIESLIAHNEYDSLVVTIHRSESVPKDIGFISSTRTLVAMAQ